MDGEGGPQKLCKPLGAAKAPGSVPRGRRSQAPRTGRGGLRQQVFVLSRLRSPGVRARGVGPAGSPGAPSGPLSRLLVAPGLAFPVSRRVARPLPPVSLCDLASS